MMIAKGILAPALACAVVLAGPASAQSLSVDDLRAQIDQKVGAQNEFQALLSDPDPARAMAAMEIMMGSGDAALMRMAVETGIFSSNPAVRATALKAFLGAKPSVTAFLTLGDAYDTSQRNWVNGQVARLGGSVTPEDVAFFSLRVGEFDAEQDCYMNADPRQGCLFRVTDQVVSFRIFDVWNGLTLDEGGELVGAVTPYANYPSAPARIPVTF
jgi:hypothetical protein